MAELAGESVVKERSSGRGRTGGNISRTGLGAKARAPRATRAPGMVVVAAKDGKNKKQNLQTQAVAVVRDVTRNLQLS